MKAKIIPNKRTFLFIFFIIPLLHGCVTIYHKDQLTLANQRFNKKNVSFKTDGYYYKKRENKNLGNYEISFSPLIFYNDGYVRVSNFMYGNDSNFQIKKDSFLRLFQDKIEKSFLDGTFHVDLNKNIWDWGLYNQKESHLTIQCYHNLQGDYVLNLYEATVLNDTTIIFNDVKELPSPYSRENKDYRKGENDIYYFKKFYMKPDSTNYIREHITEFGKNKKKKSNFNPNKNDRVK